MVRRTAGWIGFGLLLGLLALALYRPQPTAAPQDRPLPASLTTAGELRIVVLGTSLTARYDWPARLAAALEACLQRPVSVEPMAKPGASIAWGVGQAAAVLERRPDLVLIEFAVNDADLRKGLGRRRSRDLTADLLSRLAASRGAPQLALMTMSPAQGLRGVLRPGLGRRYADYRGLAETGGAGLVDLYPRWLERPPSARGLDGDGLHPDPEIAAAVIVPVLAAYVGAAAGRVCDAA